MKNKIVFWGTPNFAKIILQKLVKTDFEPELVVTAQDKPAGRGQKITSPPVKILAQKYDIPILQPQKLDKEFIYKLQGVYDLFLIAAYGKIIPKELLDIPQKGTLNIHPSLLPKLRGPSPIQYSILQGDKETGSTIILLDDKMDHGPIIAQQGGIKIKKSDTAQVLSDKLANHGADLLIKTIPEWIENKIEPQKQNHGAATYTKMIIKEEGRINWNTPASILERKLMAFSPWPGLFTFWNGKRLKILSFEIKNEKSSKPGKTAVFNDFLAIETGDKVILVKRIQLEGEKPKNAREFINGHPNIVNALLA